MRKGPSKAYSYPQCTEASKAKHKWKVLDLPHCMQKERTGRWGREGAKGSPANPSLLPCAGVPGLSSQQGCSGGLWGKESLGQAGGDTKAQAAPTGPGDVGLLGEPKGLMGPEQVLETLLPAWYHPPIWWVRQGQTEARELLEPGPRGKGKEKKGWDWEKGSKWDPNWERGDRWQKKSKNKSYWGWLNTVLRVSHIATHYNIL